jgi:hypothetical protein
MADAELAILASLSSIALAMNFFDRLSLLGCRQLFKTKEGRLGLVKRGVQPGDTVCVLDGSPTPHVIRNWRTSDQATQIWHFIGDAYVHGLMSGEVDALGIESVDIVLE